MKIFLLALALVASFVLPLVAADKAKPTPPKGVRNVGVEEFDKLRADKNAVVLDVRTEDEFKEGHIPGAVNLDFLSADFQQKAAKLDKSKTYLVHCASGRRSVGAINVLSKAAFTNLVNLEPGFHDWEKAGKPVEKTPGRQ